jgi:hypothetical protein
LAQISPLVELSLFLSQQGRRRYVDLEEKQQYGFHLSYLITLQRRGRAAASEAVLYHGADHVLAVIFTYSNVTTRLRPFLENIFVEKFLKKLIFSRNS